MKKSLMFISMMAMMAGNAVAADVLEAGTADAPKYYVIKANRGLPYVTYTAEAKNNGGAETHLYRANELSEAAVWAVVPGTEDGTVNIYNYTTKDSEDKAYMFAYITKDGSEFAGATGAVATTVSDAVNVYTNNYGDGSYGLATNNKWGFQNVDGGTLWYGLDATGGSEYLGNWWCTNADGTRWLFYAVDDSEGVEAGLETAKNAIYKETIITGVKNTLEPYIPNVPDAVAEILRNACEEVESLEYSDDLAANAEAIQTKAIADCNELLKTIFNGKCITMKSLLENQYVAAVGNAFGCDSSAAVFIMSSTENGGYTIYNWEKNVYFGKNGQSTTYVSDAAAAQTYYPQLSATSVGNGICFPSSTNFPEENAGLCINKNWGNFFYDFQITGGNAQVGVFGVAITGDVLDEIVSSVTKVLESYIPNVPESVAEILEVAANDAKKLEYSTNLIEQAQTLRTNALADANAELKTVLGGKNWALKSLRNGYATVAEGDTVVNKITNAVSKYNTYEFIKEADGGFKIYNPEVKMFFGPLIQVSAETYVSLVTAYEDALEVYPVLNYNGDYYGK